MSPLHPKSITLDRCRDGAGGTVGGTVGRSTGLIWRRKTSAVAGAQVPTPPPLALRETWSGFEIANALPVSSLPHPTFLPAS